MYKNIHGSIASNSLNLKTAEISINSTMQINTWHYIHTMKHSRTTKINKHRYPNNIDDFYEYNVKKKQNTKQEILSFHSNNV